MRSTAHQLARAITLPFLIGFAILVGLAGWAAEQELPFGVHQKAFYLSPQEINFVRPGLVTKLVSASIDAQGVIKARFKITDTRSLGLDRLGVTTPGTVGTSFVAAVLPKGQRQYTSYTTRVQTSTITNKSATQAAADANGAYEQVGDGEYIYTFRTKAPQDFDRTATHTIGVYSNRNLTEFDLGTNFDDDVLSFVPDGSAVQDTREVVKTEACNRCHDPLGVHGGSRRSVGLCILCHQPQTSDPDTGNTVDLPVLIHKIHMGAQLPSVVAGKPYQIIGNQQSVNDFSTVVFPADVRRCEVCHEQKPQGTPPAPAKQAANYITKPSRAACGACHDNVNFATGENHVDLPQISDNQCATCHIAEGELDFDASIKGAHTIPTHSRMLPGVVFEILKVDNGGPGKNPTVTFSIKNNAGDSILPSQMTRLSLTNSFSSTYDYASYVSEDARTATGNGPYTYTFKQATAADARGSFAVGIEGYKAATLLPGTKKEMANVRDAGVNKVFYYAVTDPTAVARRTVVTQAKCDACHEFLEVHGSNRNGVEYCLLCHNANATDAAQRPAAKQPNESIHFKTMIHKIHTGENLTTDFTIYGFGGNPVNFNDVRFPGDRRDCAQCHVNNSEQLPLREGLLPSQAPRDLITVKQPIQAACLACHTDRPPAAHAALNTSPQLGESCEVCHGPNADFSIDKVHARP
jgi:OmcA/MtrC family decaheme c-type cytochrome